MYTTLVKKKNPVYRIQNLPRQSSLQELPIQADTIHEVIEDRSQLARLLPEQRRKTRWKQREWSVTRSFLEMVNTFEV